MKVSILKIIFFQIYFLLLFCSSTFSSPRAGFFLPDSIREVSFKYRSLNNLIILPVIINDTVSVNLVLDTGCRNLVLFGNRFTKLFIFEPNSKVQFSGLGSGKPIFGKLSLNNAVTMDAVIGETIPVVVVPDKNVFYGLRQIHGVIGYDILVKFEIELNPKKHLITFRPAATAVAPYGYATIPVRIDDSRPILDSHISINNQAVQGLDLMIDTGSSLGLLLKTTDLKKFQPQYEEEIMGEGFNGFIRGFEATCEKLQVQNLEMKNLSASITKSPWHNYASIGMDILKDYSIILNYCKAYACFRKL